MSSWARMFRTVLAALLLALPVPSAVYGADSPDETLLAEYDPLRELAG